MTAEQAWWIASVCVRYNALPFLWVGQYGSHYSLLRWKPTAWVH